ncbi:MAG: tetratricopeptide repeat protein [Anaerolineales bacterium]
MEKLELQRLTTLKNIFPEESWSWAITALRRNPTIWKSLDSVDFSQNLIDELGPDPENWSPARISAAWLAKEGHEEIPVPVHSFDELSAEIKGEVHRASQDYQKDLENPPDVIESILLALGLLAERDAGKGWKEIIDQFSQRVPWTGPLAVLFSLVENRTEFLQNLEPEAALQVLLANPIQPQVLTEILIEVVSKVEISELEKWLKVIEKEVPELVSMIAQALLISLDLKPETVPEILVLSTLNQLAGNQSKALTLLEKATEKNHRIQGKLTANLNKVKSYLDEPQISDPAWQELKGTLGNLDQMSENLGEIADIIHALLEKKQYAAVADLVGKIPDPLPEDPGLLLVLGEFAQTQQQPVRAEQLGRQALQLSAGATPPERLSSLLFKLGLFEESQLAARAYLDKYPNHLESHLNYIESLRSLGSYQEAAKAAQILTVLVPKDINLQRKLAGYLEDAQSWTEALEVRASILTKGQGSPEGGLASHSVLPLEDLLSFADCAYSAGHFNRTVSACNQILAQDMDNSLALGLKGKSLCALDKSQEGFAHLTRAVEIDPALESSWLTLAECQLGAKSIDQALQTLKSGLTAATSKARLYTQLGQIEFRQRNYSKALEIYQKASAAAEAEGCDQKAVTAIELGISETYHQLGHYDQARTILKDLNQRYPANQQANYLYGKLLLEVHQPAEALPYLVQVVDHNPEDAQAYLMYADALLQLGDNTKRASEALAKALEHDPDNEIARVLLAEAQAAEGNYKKSVLSFQRVRESGLMIDPVWSPRISVGLGNAALKLGEIETAIAALKDGQDRFPSDLGLIRNLAKAYQAADLIDNAVDTARRAAEIAPQDPENLSWIAEFTLELGCPEEGISAIKNLILVNPDLPAAYLHLGRAQASAGNLKESAAAFSTLASFEDIQPEDLLSAGRELIKLGELEIGLESLSKAITICEANPEPSPLLPKIWSLQAAGYEQVEDYQKALDLLDQAISAELDEPEWRIQKADLLIKSGRNQAAIASLENALELVPGESALQAKLARVQRQTGAYEDAFYHAQEALTAIQSQEPPQESSDVLALAADLALATLRGETASDLLINLDVADITQAETLSEGELIAFCMAAETALDQGEEIKAAEISNQLVLLQAGHPRVGALQARILNRQGLLEESRNRYYEALDNWKKTPLADRIFPTGMEIALGKTALEILCWDEAAAHLQHAVDTSPKEKRALYELAAGYIELAETRRFYETFKVIHNAPGTICLSNEVYKNFQACLKALEALDADTDLVRHLSARGNAVFTPTQDHAEILQALAESPRDRAAAIAAYRHSRQKVFAAQEAEKGFSDLGQDPQLDAQISLALLKIQPDKAYKAAHSALEASKRSALGQVPIFYVLLAQAARDVDDLAGAEQAMEKALQTWDAEPRWFAQAAEISQEYTQAVDHYQKAIDLEPEYTGHYLALGTIHLNAKQTLPAVKCFEKALEINPELADAWIQRALAKRAQQRMPEALASINQALSLAPEHKEARKTAALLNFENGKYRESEKHLVALLGQEPNDTELLALFARTLTAQKQSDQAMRVIEKAINLEEDSLSLKLERAAMIKQIEGPHAAVDQLRIISSSYPDRYPLIIDLVSTLAEAGELDEAIRTALEALGRDDIGHTNEQKAHLYLITGKLLRNNGQLDQAVHHLYQAKKLVEPNYDAVLELGRVHYDRRQYDMALSRIQEAIEIEPDEAEAYYQAGKVLKELKKYSQAEKMLRKASKLAPNDLKIHRQLGVLVTLNLVHGENNKHEVPV